MCELASFNGNKLRQFIDVSDLLAVNCLPVCEGLYTRILNNQWSAIDYVLLSENLSRNVTRVLIDENGIFDLHSDHVIIRTELKTNLRKIENKHKKPAFIWEINNKTDWDIFQKTLKIHLWHLSTF